MSYTVDVRDIVYGLDDLEPLVPRRDTTSRSHRSLGGKDHRESNFDESSLSCLLRRLSNRSSFVSYLSSAPTLFTGRVVVVLLHLFVLFPDVRIDTP